MTRIYFDWFLEHFIIIVVSGGPPLGMPRPDRGNFWLELRAGPISGRGIDTPVVWLSSKSEFPLKIDFGYA